MQNEVSSFIETIDLVACDIGYVKCKITEKFPIHGERTYEVNNLRYEEEDGKIYFGDEDETFEDSTYVMNGFIESYVKSVKQNDNVFTLNFDDGQVVIELQLN